MSLYPVSIRRCQHIKVNGVQCASPAVRDEMYCYFHMRWHNASMSVMRKDRDHWIPGLPTLEDANSIQVGLAEVMRLLVSEEIDHRTGALLLYAMQTASANLRGTSFEPKQLTHVVIDRDSVARRPLGATAWSKVEGCEFDEVENDDVTKNDHAKDESAREAREFREDLMRLAAGNARDPDFLDRPRPDLVDPQEKDPVQSGGQRSGNNAPSA